jgi:hypothetical protein
MLTEQEAEMAEQGFVLPLQGNESFMLAAVLAAHIAVLGLTSAEAAEAVILQ